MFKQHFRFNKVNFKRILSLIEDDLAYTTRRNNPLTPTQQLCIALSFYAGVSFQKTIGLVAGVSQYSAWKAIHRVTDALITYKNRYIHLPPKQTLEDTARRMLQRYNIPNLGFGIDGMLVFFSQAPRGIPDPNLRGQHFWCRKNRYALNTQIVGGDNGLIYDLDVGWPGSVHDARIFYNSDFNEILHQQPNNQRKFAVAADSAYPIRYNDVYD